MKRRRRYRVLLINCDCASGIKAIIERKNYFMMGPRCPYCNRNLGIMQYTDTQFTCMAEGDLEAIRKYRESQK